ncbi:MAG TPA: sulfite exporter TauE/SafE family protein [Candidatus Limnocylindrales bacterium]
MTILLVLAAAGFGAGVFGSLLGLGGGVLIVPLLTFGFGLPFREAVGVSLVCVIVTSSAAAGVYLERHLANMRLGMLLEVFTVSGALVGGLVAFLLPDRVLAGLFAILLVYTGVTMMLRGATARGDAGPVVAAEGPAGPAEAAGAFRAALGGPGYRPARLGVGIAGSLFAGMVSALLGVGGGIVKVPLMHLVMGIPLKVATATSNFMIGVTGAASAIVYLMRGGIDPLVVGPTAVGVFAGAMVGSRVAQRIELRLLRLLFAAVMALTALQMALRALG